VQSCVGDELLRGAGSPRKDIAGIIVGILATFVGPKCCRGVAKNRRSSRTFKTIRRAVTDEINYSRPVGQLPTKVVVLLTTAILPEVELTVMVPTASGVGRSSVRRLPAIPDQKILTRLQCEVRQRSYQPV
jgi:hypothetical protein